MKTYVDVNLIPENPAENKIKKSIADSWATHV